MSIYLGVDVGATKHCTGCGEDLPHSDFYKDKRVKGGLRSQCKGCYRAYYELRKEDIKTNHKRFRIEHQDEIRERELQYRETRRAEIAERARCYRRENCEKVNAAARARYHARPVENKAVHAVGRAMKRGELTRQPCEVCGVTNGIEAHHDDYSKPLEVRWLCRSHHRRLHAEKARAAS